MNWPPVLLVAQVLDALTQIQNIDSLHLIILVHLIKPVSTTLTSTLFPRSSIRIISSSSSLSGSLFHVLVVKEPGSLELKVHALD